LKKRSFILEDKEEIHLVKKVSKELGMTYKELGEAIGYSESNLRRSVSTNQISLQLKKALELYLEIRNLKEKEKKTKELKDILKTLILE
jgi:ribosome-binding protein aMBF1 (putative translation factor)